MEGLITGPLARVLEEGRSSFNARYAEAARALPGLTPSAFGQHLARVVAPIVAEVERVEPRRTTAVADGLYDVSLELVGRELLGPGARALVLAEGWARLMPRLARWLAVDPRRTAGSISNALYNLAQAPGARPGDWMAAMEMAAAVAPDLESLLVAGQVAAWRAGLAHHRRQALEICRSLPPTLGCVALGSSTEPPPTALGPMLDRLLADPWLVPAVAQAGQRQPRRVPRVVARVGAFRGFGGLFLAPPTVRVVGASFVVEAAGERWLLSADRFGATLLRLQDEAALAELASEPLSPPAFTLDDGGRVNGDGFSHPFLELAWSASRASTAHTLAVTLPHSHTVVLVALVDAE